MIVRGFRPVAWVAGVGASALACYMLSLQVASERAELARVERQIVIAHQDIRALQTELGTRGRLQQLEQWNAEVLALSAPIAGQFLESNISLARFDVRQPVVDPGADVRLASADSGPGAAAPVAANAAVRLASAESDAATPLPAQSLVHRASLPAIRPAAPVTAVQARSASLADDIDLGDLDEASLGEREAGTAR